MQLMTLNIWGGRVYQPLINFIEQHREVDIFCLQEVYHKAPQQISTEDKSYHLDIYSEIQNILINHQGFFRPVVSNIYGIAIFIKNKIDILGEGEIIIHHNPTYPGTGPAHSRNLQWLECFFNDKFYSIINVHGLWNGRGKTDTPERLVQSKQIRNFLETISIPKILCGDFNLRPDTESLQLLEQDMKNLIKNNNITSTRTSLYPKDEKYADYILVSSEIRVNRFEVLTDEVSDHAPLLLEFI